MQHCSRPQLILRPFTGTVHRYRTEVTRYQHQHNILSSACDHGLTGAGDGPGSVEEAVLLPVLAVGAGRHCAGLRHHHQLPRRLPGLSSSPHYLPTLSSRVQSEEISCSYYALGILFMFLPVLFAILFFTVLLVRESAEFESVLEYVLIITLL